MKTKIKCFKLVSMMLCLIMVLLYVPTDVSAAGEVTKSGGANAYISELTIGGVNITDCTTTMSGTNWKVNGSVITVSGNLDGASGIIIKGKASSSVNTITLVVTNDCKINSTYYGIQSNTDLNISISGQGSGGPELYITSGYYGIDCHGSLTIQGIGKINIESNNPSTAVAAINQTGYVRDILSVGTSIRMNIDWRANSSTDVYGLKGVCDFGSQVGKVSIYTSNEGSGEGCFADSNLDLDQLKKIANVYDPNEEQLDINLKTISGLNIKTSGITLGKTPYDVSASLSRGNMTVTSIAVMKNGQPYNNAFAEGQTYDIKVYISLATGYELSWKALVTFNSKTPDSIQLITDGKYCITGKVSIPKTPTYTITYEMNGHGVQIPTQSVYSGTIPEKPENPSEYGYTFGGWYKDKSLTTAYNFTSTMSGNITLYAKWTANTQIKSVSISGLKKPVLGETADANLKNVTIPSTANYTIKSKTWYVRSGSNPFTAMSSTSKFETGKSYYYSITLVPKTGYYFPLGKETATFCYDYNGTGSVSSLSVDSYTVIHADGIENDGVLLVSGEMFSLDEPVLTQATVKVTTADKDHIVAELLCKGNDMSALEYSFYASDTPNDQSSFKQISAWKKDNTLDWKPSKFGEYTIIGKARIAGKPSSEKSDSCIYSYHPSIKGICQMPYGMVEPGQSGYLIGIESYPASAECVEMLILDCTTMQWVYSTGPNPVGVHNEYCLWTVWQPQYGYYWTLFRAYDKNGNLIDEICYGFENIC